MLTSCSSLVRNYRYPSGLGTRDGGDGGDGMPMMKFGSSFVRGTALSLLRDPGTTARVAGVVLLQRPRELITGNIPGKREVRYAPEEAPGTDRFEALLDGKRIPAPVHGKITWLVDGKRFFPEFERRIASARSSVDVQAYIFDNDDVAVGIADLLKKRSQEVPVRVVFDDLGSSVASAKKPETPFPAGFTPPARMNFHLESGSNVKVRSMLNPWLVCDHTKLHVFDGKVALMGCMNIGREYSSEWHDLMFRVEGNAVAELQKDFNKTWRRASPLGIFDFSKKTTPPPVPAVAGQVPLRVLRTDPAVGRYEIYKATLLGIRAARKRIWIEDPYISNDDITEALEDAARRGVDVRVIYPGKNDSKIMDAANRTFADNLVKAGGKAYAYPRMSHLKVILCDDWACVGSANLDTLSMRINRELNLSFNAKEPVNALIREVFAPDFARSTAHVVSTKARNPIAEAVADQL